MQIFLHVFCVCASMRIQIGNVTESVTDNASGNEKEETRNLQLSETGILTKRVGCKMAMQTVTENEKERQK